jgi:hypothetical protein
MMCPRPSARPVRPPARRSRSPSRPHGDRALGASWHECVCGLERRGDVLRADCWSSVAVAVSARTRRGSVRSATADVHFIGIREGVYLHVGSAKEGSWDEHPGERSYSEKMRRRQLPQVSVNRTTDAPHMEGCRNAPHGRRLWPHECDYISTCAELRVHNSPIPEDKGRDKQDLGVHTQH